MSECEFIYYDYSTLMAPLEEEEVQEEENNNSEREEIIRNRYRVI